MSGAPVTRLKVTDLPPAELPELMQALASCIPGSAWFSETHHQPHCEVEDGLFDAERCACDLVDVEIQRLQPGEPVKRQPNDVREDLARWQE